MSRLLRLALLLALLWPAPAAAQSSAELRARVDSLQREFTMVSARQEAERLAADSALGWHRLVDGPIRLDIAGPLARTAATELAAARGRLVALFGDAAGAGDRIPIRATPRVPGAGELPSIRRPLGVSVQYDSVTVPGQPSSARWVAEGAAAGQLADAIVLVAAEGRWYRVDRTLAHWHPAPPGMVPDSVLAHRSYVELATSDFPAAGPCLGGALGDCARLLGLVPAPADLVGSYSPADRRAFVRRLAGGYLGELSGRSEQCVQGNDQAACDAVLAGRDWGALVPLGESSRALLLAKALALGGPGVVPRLLEHPERALEQRLAAAAGVSRDSLLATWRAAALAARDDPRTELPRTAVVAAGWGLLIFALTIGGARWR